MSTELITLDNQERTFALEQRKAQAMISGNILPAHFKNVGDIIILGEMSKSLNIPVVMLAQQLYIVKGKPSMSGQLTIALLNGSGKFDKPIKFQERETPWGIRAVGLIDGEEYFGEWIDDALIKANAWGTNKHWAANKGLMARYRAASWFARLYAPEVLMGFQTEGEIIDAEVEEYIAPALQQKKPPKRKRRTKAEIEAERVAYEKEFNVENFSEGGIIEDDKPIEPAGFVHETEYTEAAPKPTSKPLRTYYPSLLSNGLKNSDLNAFIQHFNLSNDNAEKFLENESELVALVEEFNAIPL